MTTKAIMSAPLPRVFEESAGGKAVPVPTAPGQNGNIGGDFRADELVRVSKDTVSDLLCSMIFCHSQTCFETFESICKIYVGEMHTDLVLVAVEKAGGRGAGTNGEVDNSIFHSAGTMISAGRLHLSVRVAQLHVILAVLPQ